MTEASDRDAVIAALDSVVDPKSGRGLMAAGLVRGLVVGDGKAGFALEIAAADAAVYAPVRDAVEAALLAVPGIQRAHVVLTAEQTPSRPARGAGLSRAALDQGRPPAPVATDRPADVRRVIAVASGKGGVGKTSIACATAITLARQGRTALLVSTDPASNVGQVFGVSIGNQITAIPAVPGLAALEIDPQAAAAVYRERIVGPVRGVLPDSVV